MNNVRREKGKWKNCGTTILEMVVSFALLGIFVSASTVIISNVTNLYYHVRGENYARQVGDIVMNKIASEISGAEFSNFQAMNPCIDYPDFTTTSGTKSNAVSLYDRTDTRLQISARDGMLNIHYYEIDDTDATKNYQSVDWNFDKKMYNGYSIKELYIIPAKEAMNNTMAGRYNLTGEANKYPGNVVAIYMLMKSDRYGEFKVCRYVKIHNAPDTAQWVLDDDTNPTCWTLANNP